MSDEPIQSWQSLALGCAIIKPGSSKQFNTGEWRSQKRPMTNAKKCIMCGMCYILCPDMCYTLQNSLNENYYAWNSFYCKGCGICIYECPKQAISWQDDKKENQ